MVTHPVDYKFYTVYMLTRYSNYNNTFNLAVRVSFLAYRCSLSRAYYVYVFLGRTSRRTLVVSLNFNISRALFFGRYHHFDPAERGTVDCYETAPGMCIITALLSD